jgi:tellurite resistance protein TehA-like permease
MDWLASCKSGSSSPARFARRRPWQTAYSLQAKGNDIVTDLVFSQLGDVFRIGLIIALVVTMRRTSTVTGHVLPLVAGVVFVAVILPSTMPSSSGHLTNEIIAGLISNLIILVPVLVLARLFTHLRR